jgi:hypothetical protein
MSPVDPALFGAQSAFVEQCYAGLQLKTGSHDRVWGLGEADWGADLKAGTLTFTTPTMQTVCSVQVIGTYNTQDGTFLWGWEHPSVPELLGAHARLVRDFAAEHGLNDLLLNPLGCTEDDIWAFGALATALGGAQGAYRGPAGTTLVMMTFSDVSISGGPISGGAVSRG